MLDYSRYHRAMVAVSDRGYAFVYWVQRMLVALNDQNYGRGKDHWFEYLGKKSVQECKDFYPQTPILSTKDPRINRFCQDKIRELEDLVAAE